MAMSGLDITILRNLAGVVATRVRGAATILIDETLIAGGAAGTYALRLGSLTNGSIDDEMMIPLSPGSNTVSFETEIRVNGGDPFAFRLEVIPADVDDVLVSWASIDVTQLDLLTNDIGDAVTTPLVMTPVAVSGSNPGGSGGCWVKKTGALASVTTIEIQGFYNNYVAAGVPLFDTAEVYAPRWFNEADYEPITPVAIPVFGPESGREGDWGWSASGEPSKPVDFPDADSAVLCKVKIDGGAPVLALLSHIYGS